MQGESGSSSTGMGKACQVPGQHSKCKLCPDRGIWVLQGKSGIRSSGMGPARQVPGLCLKRSPRLCPDCGIWILQGKSGIRSSGMGQAGQVPGLRSKCSPKLWPDCAKWTLQGKSGIRSSGMGQAGQVSGLRAADSAGAAAALRQIRDTTSWERDGAPGSHPTRVPTHSAGVNDRLCIPQQVVSNK